MRALKNKAAEYFQKKPKPLEDNQTKLNRIEAKCIAKHIGIDEQQIGQYEAFFEQVVKMKLPKNYTRHANQDNNKIIYVDELTGQSDDLHPNIDIIKSTFYKMISEFRAVATFKTKTKKLLLFVQEKMMKQAIGLSSKRRDAQKMNMQRDEHGKIVISKLARIAPDLRGLIGARSYMLKALVEKIYTKKQLWGKGKRASVYAAVLASEKHNKNQGNQIVAEQQQTEETLENYERIYMQSKKYYQRNFGYLQMIPQYLKKTKKYLRSTPESVLRNINILNINKSHIQLFWFAQLLQCLPLPDDWSVNPGQTFDTFFYEPDGIRFDFHPAYIYVLQLISKFKVQYQKMDVLYQNYYNNMKQMVFYDFFQRPYNVDLFAYIQKVNDLPLTARKIIKKSQQLSKNDWMALEGVKNSDLKVQSYILIEDLLNYWGTLNSQQDNYSPSISPFGQVIWSNNINQRTIQYCPHAKILKIIVAKKQIDIPQIQQKDLKKFKDTQEEHKQFIYSISQQRQKFLKHFIHHDPKPLSQAYEIPKNYLQNQYYDSIFISPFDLQSDLRLSETPLWLQKVHAKRQVSILNGLINQLDDSDIQSFQKIKQKYVNQAVDLVKWFDPERQNQIISKIDQVINGKELKKFISMVNNLSQNYESKKKLNKRVFKDDSQQSSNQTSFISRILNQNQTVKQQSEDGIYIQKTEDKFDLSWLTKPNERPERIKKFDEEIESLKFNSEEIVDQKVPEKYSSVVLNKDQSIQKLSSKQLSQRLKQLSKSKILKHKYSPSPIKQIVKRLSKQSQKEQSLNDDTKMNLIISRLNSQHAPYKTTPHQKKGSKIKMSSALHMPDVTEEFSVFRSEMSQFGNSSIRQQIQKYKETILQKSKKQQIAKQKQQQINAADETNETIELQPLKRVKPDINEDPFLLHIAKVKQTSQFRQTFHSTSPVKKNKMRMTDSFFKQLEEQTEDTSSKFYRNSTIQLKSFSNNRIKQTFQKTTRDRPLISEQNEQIFNQTARLSKSKSAMSMHSPTKYNRLCLKDSAKALLCSEAITRKKDLIILEARKSLMSKGRGIQTLISRKY